MGMSICGFDFKDTFFNGKKGDIESTTTKIENEDVSLLLLLSVESVSNSGSSWLIDNSKNVDSRNGTSILGSLSLSIIEISWDSNNS